MLVIKKITFSVFCNLILFVLATSSIYYNFYIKNQMLVIQEEIIRVEQKIKEENKLIQLTQEEIYQLIAPERLAQISQKYLKLYPPTLNQIIKNPMNQTAQNK